MATYIDWSFVFGQFFFENLSRAFFIKEETIEYKIISGHC